MASLSVRLGACPTVYHLDEHTIAACSVLRTLHAMPRVCLAEPVRIEPRKDVETMRRALQIAGALGVLAGLGATAVVDGEPALPDDVAEELRYLGLSIHPVVSPQYYQLRAHIPDVEDRMCLIPANGTVARALTAATTRAGPERLAALPFGLQACSGLGHLIKHVYDRATDRPQFARYMVVLDTVLDVDLSVPPGRRWRSKNTVWHYLTDEEKHRVDDEVEQITVTDDEGYDSAGDYAENYASDADA